MKRYLIGLIAVIGLGCSSQPKDSSEVTNSEPARSTASSEQLGRPVYLNYCGGKITLNEAGNGDLSIQLEGVNTNRCGQLTVSDNSSRRTIKSYDIQGTSYTLSKKMLESLSDDCQVNFRIHSSYNSDGFIVYIPWCRPNSGGGSSHNGIVSYQLSNNDNCKLMINGNYSGKNVGNDYCQGAERKSDIISYEWSQKKNCKLMINGDYANRNVADKYCR